MRDEVPDRRTEEALARFEAIASRLGRHGKSGPSMRELSANPIPWTGGTYRRRSVATLYRYAKAARERRLAGLYRQRRSDAGKRTAIPPDLFALCCALREKFPAMSSGQIKETLVAEGVPHAEGIAASTLRRWLREQHLARRSAKQVGPRQRAFVRWECSVANELWLADATPGVFLPNPERPGKFRSTQLLLLEDGYSRRVVGGGFYWNQQLPALDDSFYRSTLAWGIPAQIYVDRGNIFVSKHFRRLCAELGVELIHARSAWAKGKIERIIRTAQDATFAQLRDLVERGEITDLEGLNAAFWLWLDQVYHQREHSQTGQAPAVRLTTPVNPVADVMAHEQTFLWQLTRMVRQAGCSVELYGNTYEVDRMLAGARVQVRFNPYRLQTIAIWHEGSFRQTATAGRLNRERHPQVSPLPETGPLPTPTTLNQLAGLRRRAQREQPQSSVAFAAGSAAAPIRLTEVLAEVLARPLDAREQQAVRRHWQRYGPFDPRTRLTLLQRFVEQKGTSHHITVYLDLCRPEGDIQ